MKKKNDVVLLGGFGEMKSNSGTQWYGKENEMGKLRIRKLTEGECMRLMGFEKKDTEACREAGLSKANIYHQSGDSIITTVLAGLFAEIIGVEDYREKIDSYADKLHEEVA